MHRPVRDRTVLIVADFENENEVSEVGILRIAPPMVQLVASNLEIVNQTIDEFIESADDDGIFRGFPDSEARVEW
ncbi:hypothetical protein QCA50_010654 [Cerrena zonata]|uniref:DUF6924 domain-containing protein n=1 Tax=Cerrena zonata TaxID=2478898 RepID=A0AAW0FZ09_9APHY